MPPLTGAAHAHMQGRSWRRLWLQSRHRWGASLCRKYWVPARVWWLAQVLLFALCAQAVRFARLLHSGPPWTTFSECLSAPCLALVQALSAGAGQASWLPRHWSAAAAQQARPFVQAS